MLFVDPLLTGRENLVLIGELQQLSRRDARTRADALLEQFNLADAADKVVGDYSGGMRRRLDLSTTLIADPEILFLDEPTTGLDPRARAELWDVLDTLTQTGTTILLTTQYLEEADRLADDILVIDHGKVIAQGDARSLKRQVGGDNIGVTVSDVERLDEAPEILGRLTGAEPVIDRPVRTAVAPTHDGVAGLGQVANALGLIHLQHHVRLNESLNGGVVALEIISPRSCFAAATERVWRFCEAQIQVRRARDVELVVSDTGSGIDPAQVERLLAPFEQANDARRAQGVGLGLSIVQRLVSSMRGTLRIEGKPGAGTTVRVSLPLASAQPASKAGRSHKVRASRQTGASALVVDDSGPARELMRVLLSRAGYRVLEAASSKEALARFAEAPCELVLLDYQLPDADGIETGEKGKRTLIPTLDLSLHNHCSDTMLK